MQYETNLDAEVAAALAHEVAVSYTCLDDVYRARCEQAGRPVLQSPLVNHIDVTIGDGSQSVPVRIHLPRNRPGELPCLLWLHGGGYMFGSYDTYEQWVDGCVETLNCTVVSPNYRLAPENPHPAALDDCYATLLWIVSHASDIHVDPSRILVGGASAGGGLAAALALFARDQGFRHLTHQLLIYPMLDDRMDRYPSSRIKTPRWSRESNAFGWASYLGTGGKPHFAVSMYAAAARATDLRDLPPAFVAAAGLDVLRDEAIDYARRLLGSGVMVELHVYPGVPHGFDRAAPATAPSRQLHDDVERYLRKAMSP